MPFEVGLGDARRAVLEALRPAQASAAPVMCRAEGGSGVWIEAVVVPGARPRPGGQCAVTLSVVLEEVSFALTATLTVSAPRV